MKSVVGYALLVAIVVRDATACLGTISNNRVAASIKEPPKQQRAHADRSVVRPNDDIAATHELIGQNVNVREFDDQGYRAEAGGPIDDQSLLACDFDGDCCWTNAESPLDQLQWALATGAPDAKLLNRHFEKAAEGPTGTYLMTLASTAASDEAQFSSCSIPCTKSSIKVTLRHWQTPNVLLQVCTRASFFNDPIEAPLLNCQEVRPERTPGPTTVTLPASKLVDIIIVASNLVSLTGDAVIIDDVRVAYEPCTGVQRAIEQPTGERTDGSVTPRPTAGTTRRPVAVKSGGAPAELCTQVPCGFENGDLCAYTDMADAGVPEFDKSFTVVRGAFHNQVTGISAPADGQRYAATYLLPGERAAMVTIVEADVPMVIAVQHYAATTGMLVRGCCDTPDNCPLTTDGLVTGADRTWKRTVFTCPANTQQLVFICDNMKSNQGACAFDNIHVFSQPDPEGELFECDN